MIKKILITTSSVWAFLGALVFLSSCGGEYAKVLKSTDSNYKLAMANTYFQKGDCYKSSPLYDELLKLHKGTAKSERLYFQLAASHYCEGDYMLASYYFGNYERNFPRSARRIEANYYIGKCYEALSPDPELDQEYTKKAIEHYQSFLSTYPTSDYDEEVRASLTDMQDKLLKKEADITLLYLKTEKFKPAIRAINLFLQKHSDSKYTELMKYKLVKASYGLAIRSVDEKKEARLKNVLIAYQDMKNSFPESTYFIELDKLKEQTKKEQKHLKN
ncbi:MAG: outer membrane protein assembly factor BamD [Flavobacteriales bacterium]